MSYGMHFSAGNMSIEELMQKEVEFRKKLMTAQNAGANPHILGQFEMILEDIRLAMSEKMMLEKFQREESGKKDDFDDSLSIG
jgi:hypothetical protein